MKKDNTKGLRHFIYGLIAFIILFTVAMRSHGQTYKDSVVSVSHDSSYYKLVTEKVQHDSIVKVLVQPQTGDGIWRGVYVSGLKNIAGNVSLENKLIAGLNKSTGKGNFNAVFWYSIDGANDVALTKLFTRIKRETKITENGATASSASTFINTRLKWNDTHSDSADYNTFNYELEPWNSTDVTTAWAQNVTYLQQTKAAIKNKGVKLTDYFGWWTKPPMIVQTPDTLVKYLDYGLIHDYRTKPEFSYMKSRCNDLNASGKESNTIFVIRAIFSAEPSFMQPWLKSYTLDSAYNNIKKEFDAMKYTNLRMDGYLVFTLDFWLAATTATAIQTNAMMRMESQQIDPEFTNETVQSHRQYLPFIKRVNLLNKASKKIKPTDSVNIVQ